MPYSRTPYCFQTNYASGSYSGPSTSFDPSFEINGRDSPPSHCDTNDYHNLFAGDPRLRSPSVFTDYLDFRNDTSTSQPANLEAYMSNFIRESSSDRHLYAIVAKDNGATEIPGDLKWVRKFKILFSNIGSTVRDRCKRSFETISDGKRPDCLAENLQKKPIYSKACIRGKYFLSQLENKLYDARIDMKEVVINSGYFVLRKNRRTKSQRWRERLDRSYANYHPEHNY